MDYPPNVLLMQKACGTVFGYQMGYNITFVTPEM